MDKLAVEEEMGEGDSVMESWWVTECRNFVVSGKSIKREEIKSGEGEVVIGELAKKKTFS